MADVNITITMPDARKARVRAALNGLGGEPMTLCMSDGNGISFTIQGRGGSETVRQYEKRFLRRIIRYIVQLWEQKQEDETYETNVSAVTRGVASVPEDIVT